MEHPTKIAATLTLKLRADSGYMADEQHRISADQWGRICAIVNEKPKAAAPTAEGEKNA